MDGPPCGIICQDEVVDRDIPSKEPSMEQVITIGLDLAKNVFQVHGIDAAGKVLVRRQLRRRRCPAVFWRIAALPCRHGGLRYRSSLGS